MTREENKYVKVIMKGREILLLQTYLKEIPTSELLEMSEVMLENSLLKRAIINELKMRQHKLSIEDIFQTLFIDDIEFLDE